MCIVNDETWRKLPRHRRWRQILARISSDVSLSISVHKAPYIREAYTIKKKGEQTEGKLVEIKLREEVENKKERTREKGELEELEGRLSYIGRRSCVCITRE